MTVLKELRISMKKTQKEVADFLGVDRTTYVKYENGNTEPNLDNIKRLAEYFNVTTDYLLGKSEPPASESSESKNDNGLIFSFEGNNEKNDLTSEQLQRVREMLRLAMPEQFDKNDGAKNE